LIYLTVENLTKSYGDIELFENISFGISKNQKVALIARNGAGKTSLLNILSGKDSADSGQIIFRNGITVGFLEQNPILNESLTIIEQVFSSPSKILTTIKLYEDALESQNHEQLHDLIEQMNMLKAWDYEVKVKQILAELKIDHFHQIINTLSGGQKKRIALANVLINEPDILIMDEPTNHLDLEMIEWLEEYLSKTRITLLIVTHDRYFLENVCNEVLELDEQKIFSYKGNYSYFLEKREERLHNHNTVVDKARNLLVKELDWMRRMPKARSTKAKARIDSFYTLEKVASQKTFQQEMEINVKTERLGNKILDIKSLNKKFDNITILKDFSYVFKRFEKVGIIGKNGTGKTTFLNLITGLEKQDRGKFEVGETVVFGYYKQEGLQFKDEDRVIDIVKNIAEVITLGDGKKFTASQFLNHFLFSHKMQHSPVAKLSGGEKRRLYLLTVLMCNPNFLILDEPTNDLDIIALNVLEDYLKNFSGCLIIVSHDRYFMDKVVDHLFVFEGNGVVTDFPGNYTQYRNSPKYNKQVKKLPTEIKSEVKRPTKEKPRKHSFKEKLEYDQLEKDISLLETEKKEIELQLNSGTLSSTELNELSKRYVEIETLLEKKMERWLELAEIGE